jgi:hypothetical protein
MKYKEILKNINSKGNWKGNKKKQKTDGTSQINKMIVFNNINEYIKY